MLQLAHLTSAQSVVSVSMSTPVWIVMWSDPAIRAHLRGFVSPYSRRSAMSPGISVSAIESSFLPHEARDRSATLYSIDFYR